VLDRTKEPGALGEPLYLDVIAALREARDRGDAPFGTEPRVIGGRFGLGSKEFTPAMVGSVFATLTEDRPTQHFTVGIVDDVTHTSLPLDADSWTEADDVMRAVFYGLGSDGTVGANKNSIKIIGEETALHAQGYFVYHSKKAGATTISHLRFGPHPIRAPYLIRQASFVACHQFDFLDRLDALELAGPGAVFLLNAPYAAEEVWSHLPREVQAAVLDKGLEFYAIDAYRVARDAGLGVRINTVMQTCFFALAGVLPREDAIAKIKGAIEKTYGRRGSVVVDQNFAAVDATLANLHRVDVPPEVTASRSRPPIVPDAAPDFVQRVTAVMMAAKGDHLPVSAFPVDGTWPVGTTKWEKRNLAQEIPIWDPAVCIQCNWCALVCPHAAIRAKTYDAALLGDAPAAFQSTTYRAADFKGAAFTIQVAPEDCTGCNLCVTVCPAKDKSNPRHKAINMEEQEPLRTREQESYAFFLDLPEVDRDRVTRVDARGSQLFQPLFEYSGACPGCGETPYIKLLTQLFGDRALIANATGCSSIYGGNLPTTPYTTDADGRGPAWSNSLFEDNAEFGYGFRLAIDVLTSEAHQLVRRMADSLNEGLVEGLIESTQHGEGHIREQRERVSELRRALAEIASPDARRLELLADYLVQKSIWLVGGDGWAYDIGYGGLDHVLAQRHDVNILILDTEVYSNTGGQQSKATPLGATAKFAVAGKSTAKKDLGLEAMSYGHVYVAQVALGANPNQTVRAFTEAESYQGPSMIIAHSPCIAHGYDLRYGATQQKLAVDSGAWPLFRFDPRRASQGQPLLHLDSGEPKVPIGHYMRNETRFRLVEKTNPDRYKLLAAAAQQEVARRTAVYRHLAQMALPAAASGTNADMAHTGTPEGND
jgi:pyruvate-ferredoxin/flavodoxin oxidoreductase